MAKSSSDSHSYHKTDLVSVKKNLLLQTLQINLSSKNNFPRRKKKEVGLEHPEKVFEDLEQIREVLGNTEHKIRIDNKNLITRQGTFKKNDRVKVYYRTKQSTGVISWINSNEVTLRTKNGERLKFTVDEFVKGAVYLDRMRKISE